MNSPFGFADNWKRIEPALTDEPRPPKDIWPLTGLGRMCAEMTLREAARRGVCQSRIVTTTTQRNRTPWSRVLYSRKSALQ